MPVNKKLRVGVIMGGKSSEHEVSLVSAQSVIDFLNRRKYKIILVGITKAGQWIAGPETLKILKKEDKSAINRKLVTIDINRSKLALLQSKKKYLIDVVFPVLHGPFGEDGTIQGLLEMANVPYVGANVLGSAMGMDKIIMKRLFVQAGLKTTKFVYFNQVDWQSQKKRVLKMIDNKLTFPVFVKPANLGSSIGINKAFNTYQLVKFIKESLRYDRRIIVEQGIKNPREIECSVLGNDLPQASLPGEIIPDDVFYSYQAKYVNNKAELIAPAKLPAKLIKKIQQTSLAAFKLLDISGLARADFLLENNKNLYLNELNTIPGFTAISMYPKLWQVSGVSYSKLLDILIKLALQRFRAKNRLKTYFKLKPKL